MSSVESTVRSLNSLNKHSRVIDQQLRWNFIVVVAEHGQIPSIRPAIFNVIILPGTHHTTANLTEQHPTTFGGVILCVTWARRPALQVSRGRFGSLSAPSLPYLTSPLLSHLLAPSSYQYHIFAVFAPSAQKGGSQLPQKSKAWLCFNLDLLDLTPS